LQGGAILRRTTKLILNSIGTICVGLALLGAVLPLLPTTPFLLLASACYLRGSERLHSRLVNNRLLGPYLASFRRGGGLPLRAKLYTLLLLWPSLIFSARQTDNLIVGLVLFVVGLSVSAYLLSRKTGAATG
jgi:uncharacterized protein